MCKKHLVALNFHRIAVVEHRVIHPAWREFSTHRITTGIEPVRLHAMLVEHFGMSIEYLAGRVAWPQHLFHRLEGRTHCTIHLYVIGCGFTDDQRAHESGMIVTIYSREFE